MKNAPLDRYVGSVESFRVVESEIPKSNDSVFCFDTDLSKIFGFSRVGLHLVVLPSKCRTSYPHAESLEEEFVFVLRGKPDMWLNGKIHPLRPGHAVGFPAGTGIAHNFINNSDEDVHLLVAGERTKSENLCVFPINPELRDDCKIWWGDAPLQSLGLHDGKPGPVRPEELADANAACMVYCPDQPLRTPFHYPGDNESFGVGFRISDRVGLRALGIWYETLQAGRRSAFPHAHTHEEEFVYILKGRAKIWINGSCKEVGPDSIAAFPSNTGLAHTIINDGDEDLKYICIGEMQEFKDEKIIYPLNALRRHECERKGFYWQNPPVLEWGNHNGRPIKPISDHLSLRLCTEADADEVLEIFQKSPKYFLDVEGALPSLKAAQHALVDGPQKTNENYFKEFLVIESEGRAVGVVDLHAHHPDTGVCYLGLLLLREDCFGRGLGKRCYALIEDYVQRALQCSTIKLGVSEQNHVAGFWQKMGFLPIEKRYEHRGEEKLSTVHEFAKVLK
jgi:uncharacterized cupin superfamily protein/N-acetylglutamate synthase-like GNAT family acetyltransferase